MALSFWQIALVAILFLLLFGRGKIPQLMGDLAEGIKSFKKGVSDINATNEQDEKKS
jgi:sec-independent protein translocase protein TatA